MKILQMIDIDRKQYDLQYLKPARDLYFIIIYVYISCCRSDFDFKPVLKIPTYKNKSHCYYFYFEMSDVHLAGLTFCHS